jgi:hypothetical protein
MPNQTAESLALYAVWGMTDTQPRVFHGKMEVNSMLKLFCVNRAMS